MKSLLGPGLLCASLLLIAANPAAAQLEGDGGSLPAYEVEDPSAPVVTEANLMASDRFWPYQVELEEAWGPEGREAPLPAGSRGVLIRVEPSGAARIDFGRDGVHRVPVAHTDLVARANRIRTGAESKRAPNFVLALGTKLADASGDELRPVRIAALSEYEGLYLCVFADPMSEETEVLARELSVLDARDDVRTVLFPQGRHSDRAVRDRLRSLDWPVSFVFGFLAEGYTRSLAGDLELPAVLLQSGEGRVLFSSRGKKGVASEIESALERNPRSP